MQRTLALLCSVLRVKIGTYNQKLIEVSVDDRRRHFYLVGGSGSGKTTLLNNMIADDLAAGEGLAFFDPHGDAAEEVLSLIPSKRAGDLIYINPADLERPVAWNPLFDVKQDDRPLVADGIVSAMRHVWHESWGPRMEWILLNCVRTLLDAHSTLLGIGHISTNGAFRKKAVRKVLDPSVRAFWAEFESWDDRYRREAVSPILNKIGRLVGSPAVRNILGQQESAIDIRRALDERRILIVNLSKGRIGEDNAHLLGALLVSAIVQAALSRADVAEDERAPFHLYVDEFQSFATKSFETALSEARKYALTLTMANQFTSQLPDSLRQAVLGNVGNIVSFRLGADDAPLIARHMGKPVYAEGLQDLSNFHAWGRFLVAGNPGNPTFFQTLPPPEPVNSRVDKMVGFSRLRFGKERSNVEQAIERFLAPKARKKRVQRWG